MEVYSPELVSAQQEFLIANAGQQSLAGGSAAAQKGLASLSYSALERLRNWDIGEAQLERLRRTGKVTRTLTIAAPVDGVVLDKPSVEGMRFQPGMPSTESRISIPSGLSLRFSSRIWR